MNKKHTFVILTILLAAVFCMIISCDESALINPKITESKGIPAQEIQFLQWNSDVASTLRALSKVTISEMVFTHAGGVLATDDMLGCKLIVPANAFEEEERTIQATLISEGDNMAGISFLPSQQFTKYVTIELPFNAINVDENTLVEDIRAFWLDENTNLWVEIQDVIVDLENQVVKTQTDHFTRFGWGF
ncbi:MAG: hypothetical protein JXQ65_12600 [Candidatus Marinimicrobia bacterium]|nr:hypothetical protein [Candidatus Neomarinimicrobiota bacterium]